MSAGTQPARACAAFEGCAFWEDHFLDGQSVGLAIAIGVFRHGAPRPRAVGCGLI